MKKRWCCWLGVLFLLNGGVKADESQSIFQQGNQLYKQGDFAGAAATYERILEGGKESWQLYFNLGNAYYKLHRIGPAILNYERALKLNSENEDIRFNLQLANLATLDRIPEPPKADWMRWAEALFFSISFSSLVWLTIGFYACLLVLLSLRNIKPEMTEGLVLRLMTRFLVPVLVVFTIWFGYRWYKVETESYGVVLQRNVSVTSSPVANSTEVFELHEGTKVRVEQKSDSWVKIRLRDGKVGWLQTASIGMI